MNTIKFNHDNTPNPSRFLNSYRHLGYDNYSAIADLVDNSFDAKADNVWITVDKPDAKVYRIVIGDDGCGMDKETLDQAFRLGSLINRDPNKDLGKYGVGSASASLSMARKATIITKAKGNPCLTKIVDLDHMISTNTFKAYLSESSPDEEKFLKGLDAGTAVILENCDNIHHKREDHFRSKLRKHLGQVYRVFLDSGKKIFVNGEPIWAVDPLLLSGITHEGRKYDTKIFSDETYEVRFVKDSKEVIEKVRVKIALLPEMDEKLRNLIWPKDVPKPGQEDQGFYVMRNFREIASGERLLDSYAKHNSLNRFRAEIFFSGLMDEAMGVNFTKRRVNPTQSVHDQLNDLLVEQIKTIRRMLEREGSSANGEIKESFREAEHIIESKESLLVRKPKTEEELRKDTEAQRKKQERKVRPTVDTKELLDEKGQQKKYHFDITHLGRNGIFFEVDTIGRTLVITYNADHPFYQKLYMERDRATQNAINLFIYAYVSAVRGLSPEGQETVEQMEGLWSLNLKALLD